MTPFSAFLSALAALHLAVGVSAMLAPGFVRDHLPSQYAESVDGSREWRGLGAGLTSIGVSLLVIASGVA